MFFNKILKKQFNIKTSQEVFFQYNFYNKFNKLNYISNVIKTISIEILLSN